MPHIDPALALSQFLGSLPTFVAVLLAWMHSNSRISDLNSRMSEMNRDTKDSLNRHIDDTRDCFELSSVGLKK